MCVRVFTSTAGLQVRTALRLICHTPVFQFGRTLLMLSVLIGMTACASPTPPPLTPITVQLSFSHQAEIAGLSAADQLNYFAAEGLHVSIVEGGPEVDFIACGGKPASGCVPFLLTGRDCGASSMNQIKSTCLPGGTAVQLTLATAAHPQGHAAQTDVVIGG